MTYREEMLATIHGEPTRRLPWAPRMDLWYLARRARGTLPKGFDRLNLAEVADTLGVACHSRGSDPTLPGRPDDMMLRGLGINNHPDYPFRYEVRGLPVKFRQDGDRLETVISAPAGEVTIRMEYTEEMKRNGISVPFVTQFAVRTVEDCDAVAQVFEHIEVIPQPQAYAAYHQRVGDRGLAIANGLSAASPMHLIFHNLMPTEHFFYLYSDERDQLERLASRIEPFFDRVLAAVLACKAEVVFWGANYDQNITWPAFFELEIAPWLKRLGKQLHASGKALLTHTDGELQKLLPYFPPCGFDIAESVCPRPMTRCSLREIREGMGSRITVWGGLCSVALLRSSMDDPAFEAYLDQTFGELGTGERLILGVSDMVPPDANLERLEQIRERVESFGPVTPGSEGGN